MSNRVLFGTWNDTNIPANSSGFNGFPFRSYTPAQILPDVVPFGNFPISCTLLQEIEMYWRIKEWLWTSDLALSAGGLNGMFPNIRLVSLATTAIPAWTELTLCQTNTISNNLSQNATSGTGFIAGNITGLADVRDGNDIYPYLHFQGELSVDDSAGNSAYLIFNTDPLGTGLSITPPSINATINGFTVPFYYRITLMGNGMLTWTALNIQPDEHWPYAARNASPIYNTTTGAQLQSPLN